METPKIIIGILSIILVLSNGAQYTLNETGKTSRCYGGWEFQETGEHEGSYSCTTASDIRYMYCSEVYDSSNGRINFYCMEAIPVLIDQEVITPIMPSPNHNVKSWLCSIEGCAGIPYENIN